MLACALALLATPAFGQEADCIEDLARSIESIQRGRYPALTRCLRFGNYDNCAETDAHSAAHENELRRRLTGTKSDCVRAVDAGVTLDRLGPTECPAAGADCDVAVGAISTLDDLAECAVCVLLGIDRGYRQGLGLPSERPDDVDDRRCARSLAVVAGKSGRKGVKQAFRCARGGVQPFACPADATDGTRFAKALAVIERKAGKCPVDGGGQLTGVGPSLCDAAATTRAELAACVQALMRDRVCRTVNFGLGQSQDCDAFAATPR